MKPKLRLTQVHEVQDLGPHMRRIVLRGDVLKDFPIGQESAHVKVVVPQPGETKPKLEFGFGAKKSMRSYTVHSFDAEQHRLTIDFSVNTHSGIVADWAAQAKPGDYLGLYIRFDTRKQGLISMKPKLRLTQVHEVQDLGPHMRRIVLRGDDLKDFPVGQESAHVKVIVPPPGETKPKLEFNSGAKKSMRSYTVRAFDAEQHRLTIDFSVNTHSGIVADWAVQAKPGDYLGIGGPGPVKHTDFAADWHLIVGDFSALPALAATVEKLPQSAKGYVLAQVPTVEDQQQIDIPPHLHFQWIVNPDVLRNELLLHVQQIDWMDGQPAIFIAGEASQVKAIHGYVKTQPGYQKDKTYASAYWQA